jgi:hypothetical protein
MINLWLNLKNDRISKEFTDDVDGITKAFTIIKEYIQNESITTKNYKRCKIMRGQNEILFMFDSKLSFPSTSKEYGKYLDSSYVFTKMS